MTTKIPPATDSLRQLLDGARHATGPAGYRRWYIIAGVALALVAAALFLGGSTAPAGRYLTETAARGALLVSASASGTLQPTKSVDVGSELSGTLAEVLVQENDVVKKGQVLARLDTAKLEDSVIESRAAVAAATAGVAEARATQAENRAALARMQRVAELSGGKVPARTELEAAEAAVLRAEAAEASAQAKVTQAQATLKTNETNLTKATVRSPVDGVVLTREVEPGQTVAAQMTTPVLFVLAEDLTRMELQVKVDEADVAAVKPGQPASFTVSAWPGRKFPANIRRVGLGATTTDNVVTYKTVLDVTNDDLALRPGMTATATIVTAERSDALLVANAALRYTPAETAPTTGGSLLSRLVPRPPDQPKTRPTAAAAKGKSQQVWVLDNGAPRAVDVVTGVSNGRFTEITGGELQAGMAVITEYQAVKP